MFFFEQISIKNLIVLIVNVYKNIQIILLLFYKDNFWGRFDLGPI